MANDLVKKYQPYTDDLFKTESKKSLLTNNNFSWDGASSILVYKVSTVQMNDYGRDGPEQADWSCYGPMQRPEATTEAMLLKKDRSFVMSIDTLDEDETARQLSAASSLARQIREVVIPEIDAYTYNVMCTNAGIKPDAVALTATNIYDEILKASVALDDAEVPETDRVLVVTPETYKTMKKCKDIVMETNVGNEMRLKGVLGYVDGMTVQKIPSNRLPEKFGFMIVHPSATVAPVKLADYKVTDDSWYISGDVITGRVVYDAFVLEKKAKAIYYQATT